MTYYLGVDIGTSSARVGLFTQTGRLIDFKTESISIINDQQDFYEQSSEEIWNAVCSCIRQLIQTNSDEKQLLSSSEIVSIGIHYLYLYFRVVNDTYMLTRIYVIDINSYLSNHIILYKFK